MAGRRMLSHLLAALKPRHPPHPRPAPGAAELAPPNNLATHDEASDLPGANRVGLSDAEVEFFKENGYLVKRRLIPRDVLAPFIEQIWDTSVPTRPTPPHPTPRR